MASTLKIEINDDGTVKLNARQMIGEEQELLDALNALAAEVGGELVVEAHEPGIHHHHHGHGGHTHHHRLGRK